MIRLISDHTFNLIAIKTLNTAKTIIRYRLLLLRDKTIKIKNCLI